MNSITYQQRSEIYKSFISYNNTYPLHLHGAAEIVYVLKGQIQVTVCQNTYLLTQGDLAFIFPTQPHSYLTPSDSIIRLVFFTPEYAEDFSAELLKTVPINPVIKKEALPEDIPSALQKLDKAFALKNSRLFKAYLYVVLGLCIPLLPLKPSSGEKNHTLISQLISYIDKHYEEKLTLDLLSRELAVSKFTISRIFTFELNTTFPSYLNSKRIFAAKKLLASTDKSVTDIGYEAGFSSSRSFYRSFNRAFLTSPKKYRSQLKSDET